MRKYLEVSKIYMKSQLAWRTDVIFNMLFTVTKILFAYLLWGAVFQGRGTVGPFTFHGMLSYYIVSAFLSQLEMSQGISEEIHQRIRNGTFSKYMVIPVGIEKYFMAMELGVAAFYLCFDLAAAAIWVWLFRIEFVFTGNIRVFLTALLMAVVGMFFMAQLNYLLGLLTLRFQGIDAFLMIKNNLMELVTGSIIPLALFPQGITAVARCLPFYYVTYLPSMLLTGQCENEAAAGLIIIGIWCALIQLFIHYVWKKDIRKYDGVGI
ncbi:MAG: ABC-2 family transporter protein [Roseburia sp.]|nr:ABC-2 family transporter protein [Roseburia sp.]